MSDVSAVEHYVVELDGVKYSEYACFVDAIKVGLLLHAQNRSKFAISRNPIQNRFLQEWRPSRKQVSSRLGNCLFKSLIEWRN